MPKTPPRLDEARIIANRAYGSDASHAIDPVCGREIAPHSDKAERVELNGRSYYFCSVECRSEFESNPEGHMVRNIQR